VAVYLYRCSKCSIEREESHSMSEDPLVECRWCVMTFMQRVPQVPSTQFKGSGFASNDLRSK